LLGSISINSKIIVFNLVGHMWLTI